MGFALRKPEDDRKPVAESSCRRINITVVGLNGSKVSFSIKRNTPLDRLMDAYCEAKNMDFTIFPRCQRIRFAYGKTRTYIKPEHTSEELGIVDGDEIFAYIRQFGSIFFFFFFSFIGSEILLKK
ncbi:hypothetical protein MKW94_025728 [Papaver nudicaule]|uniref:Rad60/SUMO-like domain-containing protein n=1 Tax=Papaver nudicaule TaxID=74823 RepID=A0AA42AY40_PAPNU|nr:hypothetical protein [Papaver nudicaule]